MGKHGHIAVWSAEQGPRPVFFHMQVRHLWEIDLYQQQFNAVIVLKLQRRLSGEERDAWWQDPHNFKPDWKPPPCRVENALDMTVTNSAVEVVLVKNMLMAKTQQIMEGTFSEVRASEFPL